MKQVKKREETKQSGTAIWLEQQCEPAYSFEGADNITEWESLAKRRASF